MKKFYLPIAALAALMAAGCTNEDEMAGMSGGDLTGTAMKVTTNVEVPQTRGTMTTDNLIEFYMRVTDADGTTDDYDYLVLMQKNGSEWSPSDGTELWWAGSDAQVSAVYQEDVDWSDRDVYDTYGTAVSVLTDQSSETNVQASDLLYMKPVAVSPTSYTSAQNSDGSIKVTLTHRFSLLNINISNLAGDSNPIESVTVGGTVTDATYIPAAGLDSDLTLGTTTNNIEAHEEGYDNGTASYECIILPQDISGGPLTITANIGGTEYMYTYDGNITTAANTRYTFNLAVRSDMLVGDEVTVEDWESRDVITDSMESRIPSNAIEITGSGDYYINDSRNYVVRGTYEGYISVESSSPHIYLHNASINSGGNDDAIYFYGVNPSYATIHVVGENEINESIYMTDGSLTIEGSGPGDVLSVTSSDYIGIGGTYSDIVVRNVTVRSSGGGGCPGIGFRYNLSGTITIEDATVYAYGGTFAPAIGVNEDSTPPTITISNSEIHAHRGNNLGNHNHDYIGMREGSGSINVGSGSITGSTVYCYTGSGDTPPDYTYVYDVDGNVTEQ